MPLFAYFDFANSPTERIQSPKNELMKIGCLKEIKRHEYRVGLTPSDVKSYVSRGHQVVIQQHAGEAAGFVDDEYIKAGARIESDRKVIFDNSEMIVR